MIFDDQPIYSQDIITSAPTSVQFVSRENTFHPLKIIKTDSKFKPVTYVFYNLKINDKNFDITDEGG